MQMSHNDKWPVRPRPDFDDETLSSWMARVALGNGASPRKFYLHALGWENVRSLDNDQLEDQAKLTFLANKTDTNINRLKQLRVDGDRFIAHTSGFGGSQEFTSYCPDCLEGEVPYFRKEWRSALVVVCTCHGTLLRSRCESCHVPVQLLARKGKIRLDCCGECEESLHKNVKRIPAPNFLKKFTQNILNTLSGEWFEFGPGQYVHPDLFLQGLLFLVEIVSHNDVWMRVFRHLGLEQHFEKPSWLYFQRHESFQERTVLLHALSWILADWPKRFTWAVNDLSPSIFSYLFNYGDVPFWLWTEIKEQFDVREEALNVEESQTMFRMIQTGYLDEAAYYRAFGHQHVVRINGRNLRNFNNIYKETIKHHASAPT